MSVTLSLVSQKIFQGPCIELDRQAIVLELETEGGIDIDHVWREITCRFPDLGEEQVPAAFGELFARTVIKVEQLGMNLFATGWSSREESGLHTVAVEYIDADTGEGSVEFVFDWISDILEGRQFPFKQRHSDLEWLFNRSRFGGPTIYSIIEAGYKRNIPMFYLASEDVFQWGQGRKQLRGRSTVLHLDSIKDTELTSYKDLARNFLEDLGFPVPAGELCYTLEEAQKAADRISFPVVVKPVDGHKGQGVSTDIGTRDEVRVAFGIARDASKNRRDPVIVEKHVTGTDHRLLTINGRFVAALERIPAYVTGDGTHSIEELIEMENSRPERADTPRSALGKITIDDDLINHIRHHGVSLRDVPPSDQHVVLRRVANISAGGVSVNVTDRIHPANVKLAEDVARFLDVRVLGIDLLAEDISKPWNRSPCSIIEINAGPGVFMHLVPAVGESINVPGRIMEAFFPTPESARVPTLVFNRLKEKTAKQITGLCLEHSSVEEVGVARIAGVTFNNEFFSRRPKHTSNVRNVMRNPRLDVAILEYQESVIRDEGLYHWGADIVVLDAPSSVERVLARDRLPDSMVIEVDRKNKKVIVTRNGRNRVRSFAGETCDSTIIETIRPALKRLIKRYNTTDR